MNATHSPQTDQDVRSHPRRENIEVKANDDDDDVLQQISFDPDRTDGTLQYNYIYLRIAALRRFLFSPTIESEA